MIDLALEVFEEYKSQLMLGIAQKVKNKQKRLE